MEGWDNDSGAGGRLLRPYERSPRRQDDPRRGTSHIQSSLTVNCAHSVHTMATTCRGSTPLIQAVARRRPPPPGSPMPPESETDTATVAHAASPSVCSITSVALASRRRSRHRCLILPSHPRMHHSRTRTRTPHTNIRPAPESSHVSPTAAPSGRVAQSFAIPSCRAEQQGRVEQHRLIPS